RRGYAWQELQRSDLATAFPIEAAVPFRLLLVGPYIELSIGGEVVLATLSGERLAGSWGVWTAAGRVAATGVRFASLRRPWANDSRLG
nr:hypothetical protein [Chloroflexia bacterium]